MASWLERESQQSLIMDSILTLANLISGGSGIRFLLEILDIKYEIIEKNSGHCCNIYSHHY